MLLTILLSDCGYTKMARTRGGLAGDIDGRRRPTASARRERNAPAPAPETEEDHQQDPPVDVPAQQVDTQSQSFPGGPEDTSILRRFSDHVATHLWRGDVINIKFIVIVIFGCLVIYC